MSQFCTQCGTENVNDAKFCKSCGHSLIEQQANTSSERSEVHTAPAREQEPTVKTEVEASSVENDVEGMSSWSGWLLLIPVIAWVLYRLSVLSGGNIGLMFGLMAIPNVVAEALGGAIGIVGVPLIITGIIYSVKKANGIQYVNFVKHTLIASIVLLVFAIASNIHAIRDEQKAATTQTTSEVVDAAVPVAEEAEAAVDTAAINVVTPEEKAFNNKVEKARLDGTGTLQFPVSFSEFKKAEVNCNNGQASSCADLGQMYDMGIGLQGEKDPTPYYKKACDGGNGNGCNYLGELYMGNDDIKAAKLFKKACDHGSYQGCFYLGSMYGDGQGIEQDYIEAKKYFKKACNGGNTLGCRGYEELQSQGY